MRITRRQLRQIIQEELGRLNEQDTNSFLEEEYIAPRIADGHERVDAMPVTKKGRGGSMREGPHEFRQVGWGGELWSKHEGEPAQYTGYYVVLDSGIRGSKTYEMNPVADSPESPTTKVGDNIGIGNIYAILKK